MNWFENHLNHLFNSRHYFAGHVMVISMEAKNPNKIFNIHSKLSLYQDVGEAAKDHWWEEKRNVSEVSNQTISNIQIILGFSQSKYIKHTQSSHGFKFIPASQGSDPSKLRLSNNASVLCPCPYPN